jgi:UDP-N-acetylglucosamine 3-dehydrogenase
LPAVGVIGYGLMGKRHARLYRESGLCRLTVVAEAHEQGRREAAEALGVETFSDWRALLERDDLDAVSICLPDSAHFGAVSLALELGKDVLVEKPLTTSVDEAERILELSRRSKGVLLVGHNVRFDARYCALRQAIQEGTLGEVLHLSATRSSPVTGPLRYNGRASLEFHVAIHDVDLMLWYAASPVVEVHAVGVSKRLAHLGIFDAIFTTLKFGNGAIGMLESSWSLPETYPATLDSKFKVVGTKGAALLDALDQGVLVVGEQSAIWPDTMRWTEVNGRASGILREEVLHFLACVRREQPPLVGAAEACEAVKVVVAIRRSLETGQPVPIDRASGRNSAT